MMVFNAEMMSTNMTLAGRIHGLVCPRLNRLVLTAARVIGVLQVQLSDIYTRHVVGKL